MNMSLKSIPQIISFLYDLLHQITLINLVFSFRGVGMKYVSK